MFYTGTGDSARVTRYVLDVQDEGWIIEALQGAIEFLGVPENWTQIGSISPDIAAERGNDLSITLRRDDIMIGSVILSAVDTAPTNTLLCDGSQYLRVDYPNLYAVLAAAFIVDADNFTVPNLTPPTDLNYYIVTD